MAGDGFLKRLWRIIYPILIYYGATYAVTFIATIYWTSGMDYSQNSTDHFTEIYTQVMNLYMEHAMLLTGLSALLAIPILYRIYKKDKQQQVYYVNYSGVPAYGYGLVAILGMAACLGGNLLINLLPINTAIQEYTETTAEVLYSGPLIVQYISIGLLIPICEELVFRGLIYKRLRIYMNASTAILTSAVFFGIYHGNLVQGIYGFLLGFCMAYVYEKFERLWAPIVFHVSANVFSLVLQTVGFEVSSLWMYLIIMILSFGVASLIIYLISKVVYAEIHFYEDEAPGQPEETQQN